MFETVIFSVQLTTSIRVCVQLIDSTDIGGFIPFVSGVVGWVLLCNQGLFILRYYLAASTLAAHHRRALALEKAKAGPLGGVEGFPHAAGVTSHGVPADSDRSVHLGSPSIRSKAIRQYQFGRKLQRAWESANLSANLGMRRTTSSQLRRETSGKSAANSPDPRRRMAPSIDTPTGAGRGLCGLGMENSSSSCGGGGGGGGSGGSGGGGRGGVSG